jgi:hypothetical protein
MLQVAGHASGENRPGGGGRVKLGEFFVKKGLINPKQLEEALRGQLIFGGHLGTCLIEMGYIDEHTLGKTLAEMFGVDYAPPHFLNDIPKSVIELLPRRLAEKLHAVPFERKDKSLHVAMIDPKNLPALDELAFATGHRINPWVSPEARIFQVLERYYEVPRRQRYISVCQDMDRPGADKPGRVATMPARDAFGSAYAPPPHLADLTLVANATSEDESEQGYGIPSATPPSAKPAVPQPSAAPRPSAEPQPPVVSQSPAAPSPPAAQPAIPTPATNAAAAPGRSSRPSITPPTPSVESPPAAPAITVAPAPSAPAASAFVPSAPVPSVAATVAPDVPVARFARAAAHPPASAVKPASPAPSPSLPYARAMNPGPRLRAPDAPPEGNAHQNVLSDLFCAAENASDLADIALNHAMRTLSRSALFLVKGTVASLWRWKANGPAISPITPIDLSVTDDPPFDLLLGHEFYQGVLPHNPKLTALYGPLGVDVPSEVLLIPGYLEDRLVVVFYGDGAGGPVRADIADLDLLVRKLACALQLVLIKKKVRSLERIAGAGSTEKIV